jgi:excinuclease ABC subunit C
MDINKIKKLSLPQSPGCYKYYDSQGKIIYIGKAANLRSRVLSYWRASANHSPLKYSMMKQISRVEWVETDSEIEALLLESNLIKKHQPQYNILAKDDKRHAYIKISTEEKFPRVFITRKLDKAGLFFGPFTQGLAVRETLKVIRKIWPYRSCINMPKKVCLYYQIGKCPGVCEEKISAKEYGEILKQIINFLQGKKKIVTKKIINQITNYKLQISKLNKNSKNYTELGNKINYSKYQLSNINNVLEHTKILSLSDKYASDVVELSKLLGLDKIPERIEGYDISNTLGRDAVGSMVVFVNGEPDKNEYRKFKIKLSEGEANDVKMLKEVLDRRFKHATSPYPLLHKEGKKTSPAFLLPPLLAKERVGVRSNAAWPSPDLVIIDGGKAQVNAAAQILKKNKLNIPVLGLSKGDGNRSAHAPDKIFFSGEKKSLQLPLASPALHILKRVRDEAHRFAITFHRKLRSKRWLNE